MIAKKLLVLFLLPILWCGQAFAQTTGGDERAQELVSLAKKYYSTKSYLDAAMTYDLATQRPNNDLSSFCWYMTGLSYFKAGEKLKADNAWGRFLTKFPNSAYADNARYHRALVLLESEHVNDRERGLDEMFKLVDHADDKRLRSDAEQTLKHFITNVYQPSFLDLYIKFASKEHQPWIMEAIGIQYDRTGEGYKLLERLKEYEAKGGEMTKNLKGLKSKYASGKVIFADRLNIAVFLSFNLQLVDTARSVPAKSEKALEMLEGMMLALDSLGDKQQRQINLSIYDTRGDTTLIASLLDSLQRFQPDVIIGDIRTGLASVISEWAEKNKVVHLIPRNPLNDLIVNKKYTFLVHPSLDCHGAQIARYMVDVEGKRKFLVFNDHSYYAERFAAGFKQAIADDPGVTVVEKVVPAKYAELQPRLSSEVRAMKGMGYDAVYAPFSNEESAGLLIAKLNYEGIKTEVAGGPDWEVFTVIDQELKSSYKLKYSSFYFEGNDSTGFDVLYELCLKENAYRPSNHTVQGFDLMAWLLTVSKGIDGKNSLPDLIHKAPPYHGIHQDFYFGNEQDNQKINILQYNNGRLDKVNRNQKEPSALPRGSEGDPRGGQ
ncbi:MAG TPA: ABC transporter substrate-binding protein [Bacteroidia bacterium]|nr:ABC transporter substrate-binding protein [Bacteroidia bacterium]